MKIIYLKKAHKYIQKADNELYYKIKDEVDCILKNPYGAKKLTGALKGIYSHHFAFKRAQYRIAYKIEDNKIIIVIMISNRENFYKKIH